MASGYEVLILKHCGLLEASINKRNINSRIELIQCMEDEWEFEKAVTSTIAYIGELANKLDDRFKKLNPNIDWIVLKSVRNHIDHDYDTVDFRRIVNVYYNQVVPLAKLLSA